MCHLFTFNNIHTHTHKHLYAFMLFLFCVSHFFFFSIHKSYTLNNINLHFLILMFYFLFYFSFLGFSSILSFGFSFIFSALALGFFWCCLIHFSLNFFKYFLAFYLFVFQSKWKNVEMKMIFTHFLFFFWLFESRTFHINQLFHTQTQRIFWLLL